MNVFWYWLTQVILDNRLINELLLLLLQLLLLLNTHYYVNFFLQI